MGRGQISLSSFIGLLGLVNRSFLVSNRALCLVCCLPSLRIFRFSRLNVLLGRLQVILAGTSLDIISGRADWLRQIYRTKADYPNTSSRNCRHLLDPGLASRFYVFPLFALK